MFCFSTRASVAISSTWSVLCESYSFKQNSDCSYFQNLNMVLEIHLASAMDILLPSLGHSFEAQVLTQQKKTTRRAAVVVSRTRPGQPATTGFGISSQYNPKSTSSAKTQS